MYTSNNTLTYELTGWLHSKQEKQRQWPANRQISEETARTRIRGAWMWMADTRQLYTQGRILVSTLGIAKSPTFAELLLRSETRFRMILTKCLVYQKVQERKAVLIPSTNGVLFPSDTAFPRSLPGLSPGRAPELGYQSPSTWPCSLDRTNLLSHQALGAEEASGKGYSRKSPRFGGGWNQVWLLTARF